jgi:prolyl-tRNA editing enzyme YbaK/EbsC (Cys-tRNA(Pro) deacylase)
VTAEDLRAPTAVERFAALAARRGLSVTPRRFGRSTRTAAEAAAALGVPPGRIVKSLLFFADGAPVMVLVGGDRRVDARRLAEATGARRARPATAEEVLAVSGYAVGGVPPLVETDPLARTVLDLGLVGPSPVWASAGDPHAVFACTAADLVRAANAIMADVGAGD